MTLSSGARVGPYEVLGAIGKGGMGEVYKARDTRLGRDVAIKVLPETFSTDADRLARFEREAKTLAALNDPNIAHVYGLEAGALVMEFVDGEDLSRQIARGPIALGAALAIARQVASALAAAHEQGIVHRDLKPANIKVRPDDTVKVLDFGLAKALGPEASGVTDAMSSPTLTARATELGIILGTAAYMAPEQARGKVVDRRADIWAFGVVLFEMLTGHRAFDGDEVSDVLASVLKTEPDWKLLPANLPPPVRRLLARCLEKDPKRRLRDIGEGIIQLDEGLSAGTDAFASRRRLWRRALPFVAAAFVTALAFWTGARFHTPAAVPSDVVRFSHFLPEGTELTITSPSPDLAIAHDGRTIIYAARQGAEMPRLFVRPVGQLDAQAVRGSEGGTSPFVSADNRWIGFLEIRAGRRIKKVPIDGGSPTMVAEMDRSVAGAVWLVDGTIIVGTVTGGLKRVPQGAGAPTDLTTPDRALGEASHCWPSAIPGTTIVLFTIMPADRATGGSVAAIDLATRQIARLPINGTGPRYASTGHIVYATSDGSIVVVPFDVKRLQVTGTPATVLEGISVKPGGGANFDLSDSGRLVFTGTALAGERSLMWVDRRGQETPTGAPLRNYFYPRISRQGRVALDVRDQGRDIWIWDNQRLSRLTTTEAAEEYGLWTPDGLRVIFSRRIGGRNGILWTRADAIGEPELLVERENAFPNAVTGDGKTLIFRVATVTTGGNDIFAVPLEGDRKVRTLIATKHDELNAALSPHSDWMAYQSDLSGRPEVYVRPFPNVDAGQVTVSTGGGTEPLWSPDGTEIFYRGADHRLMSVAVTMIGSELKAQPPKPLFDTSSYSSFIGRNYDITPDGKRFLMVKTPPARTPSQITVVLDWLEELKRVK